jgi:alanyl-tRNA synthetase
MTDRLYLGDPYLARFEADVLAERRLGERSAVILSRTAFYPEGGGQPADRGTLADVPVLDVQEVEGEILHFLQGPAPQPGRVVGVLDWRRRFDHMQQHHGQHLLSAAFDATLSARTVSFHLGEEACTIDLDCPIDRLGRAALLEVERAANGYVWSDLPIETRELSPEELAALPLRKAPTKGTRVVMVGDPRAPRGTSSLQAGPEPSGPRPPGLVDASPCGGTHPRRTGEVGAIAVLRAQRWGQVGRVEFACGERVLRLFRGASERLGEVSGALGCAPDEAPAAAARLAAESLAHKKELDRLALALARGDAERLAGGDGPVAAELEVPGGDVAPYLRAVAQALSAKGRLALLGARGDGRAYLCFARPKGAGPGRPDLGKLLREAVAVLQGKGGGGSEFAQGSGPGMEKLGEALELARAASERT